jgi:hypothetical protein
MEVAGVEVRGTWRGKKNMVEQLENFFSGEYNKPTRNGRGKKTNK